jgi:hypothetical protein
MKESQIHTRIQHETRRYSVDDAEAVPWLNKLDIWRARWLGAYEFSPSNLIPVTPFFQAGRMLLIILSVIYYLTSLNAVGPLFSQKILHVEYVSSNGYSFFTAATSFHGWASRLR